MELTVTEAAKQRLARYLSPAKKLILDFDDGVGPFSALGSCGLDVNFKLVFVPKNQEFPDFDASFSSDLGEIYYKGYTKPQYAEKMKLDFNPNFFTMPLTSPNGTLTDNVEIVDLAPDVLAAVTQGITHDC